MFLLDFLVFTVFADRWSPFLESPRLEMTEDYYYDLPDRRMCSERCGYGFGWLALWKLHKLAVPSYFCWGTDSGCTFTSKWWVVRFDVSSCSTREMCQLMWVVQWQRCEGLFCESQGHDLVPWLYFWWCFFFLGTRYWYKKRIWALQDAVPIWENAQLWIFEAVPRNGQKAPKSAWFLFAVLEQTLASIAPRFYDFIAISRSAMLLPMPLLGCLQSPSFGQRCGSLETACHLSTSVPVPPGDL